MIISVNHFVGERQNIFVVKIAASGYNLLTNDERKIFQGGGDDETVPAVRGGDIFAWRIFACAVPFRKETFQTAESF